MDSSMWDERYSGSDLVWSATPNQWVEQVAAERPPGRVLDLAGGEGRNALWLADRGWKATVVDFSHVALDRADNLVAERFGDQVVTRRTSRTAWADRRTQPSSTPSKTIAADLAGCGLAIGRAETVTRTVATDEGPRGAVDALLVARNSTA